MRTLKPYSDRKSVAHSLFYLLVAGIGLAYGVALLVRPPASEGVVFGEYGAIGNWFWELASGSPLLLPLAILLIVLGLTFVAHGLAVLAGIFHRAMVKLGFDPWSGKLTGTLENSINGGLAFSAVNIPYVVAVSTLWLHVVPLVDPATLRWLRIVVALLIYLPLLVYFPLAWTAAHPNMTKRDAYSLVGGIGTMFAMMFALSDIVCAA